MSAYKLMQGAVRAGTRQQFTVTIQFTKALQSQIALQFTIRLQPTAIKHIDFFRRKK